MYNNNSAEQKSERKPIQEEQKMPSRIDQKEEEDLNQSLIS